MIITDGVHLVSTLREEELHHFARKIGLKVEWFQDDDKHPHYDLTTARAAARAAASGAVRVTTRQVVKNNYAVRKRPEGGERVLLLRDPDDTASPLDVCATIVSYQGGLSEMVTLELDLDDMRERDDPDGLCECEFADVVYR